MAIVRTEVIITSSDTDYQVPGDLSPQAIINAYSGSIPGLSNMTHTSRVETRDGVQVRVVTFSPKTGTKGAVVRTEVIITSSDTDYQVPGDLSPQAIINAYSGSIPGLSNMTHTSRLETRDGVEIRVVTFSPKTGTKG